MTTLSLEPSKLYAHDDHDLDLFATPARLHSVVLEDGSEVFTRADPKKSLQERLARVWAERGDYSQLTEERVLNPPEEDDGDKQDDDTRPSVEDIRKLQESMLKGLDIARGELTTALDLLSVLSAPTDPPDIDPASLPLPQQTLTLVPTAIPPPSSLDPAENPNAALPLAISLSALKSSASAFFAASEELIPLDPLELAALPPAAVASRSRPRTRAPDPWPTLLNLHATSGRVLVPLGAQKGAALTGKGESRTARQVGVVFGAQEAKEPFRSAAVARMGELVEEEAKERTGRKLMIEVETGGVVERAVWEAGREEEGVESILKARGRAAFAEELFAQLADEAKKDGALRAKLKIGTRKEGDSVEMEGNGWVLRVVLVVSPPPNLPPPTGEASTVFILLPVLRLLYLGTYSLRRRPSLSSPPEPPLLATLSAVLSYLRRFVVLEYLLGRLLKRVEEAGGKGTVEFVGSEGGEEGREAAVLRLVHGGTELGGRAVLRVGKTHTFHVFHSFPLPSSSSSNAQTQPTLTLRLPGKPAPIPIPSMRILEEFLGEQVDGALRASVGRGKKVEGAAEGKKGEEQEEVEEDEEDDMEEV